MSKFIFTIALLVNFVAISPSAFCSGGIAGNAGAFVIDTSDGGNKRYKVELNAVDQLLVGAASSEVIEFITIHAPGTNDREILVREKMENDGMISLLLTAPDDLAKKIQRASVHLKPAYVNKAHIITFDGHWKSPSSVSIPLAQESQSSQGRVTVFHLSPLGENGLMEDMPHLPGKSHSSVSGRNILNALWPWLMSFVLLMLAWAVSRWRHTAVRRRAR